MLHFGIEKLEYKIRFDRSCYYPYTLNEERKHTKLLFGACFGLWWFNNSISISFKPSENKLDKIELFRYIFADEFEENKCIGSLDIEKDYTLKMTFDRYNNLYIIQVYPEGGSQPIINFSKQYKYPSFAFGYSIKKDYGTKVLLEKK